MKWTDTTLTFTKSSNGVKKSPAKRAKKPKKVNYDTTNYDIRLLGSLYREPSITVPEPNHTPILVELPVEIPSAQFPPAEWTMARQKKGYLFAKVCLNGQKYELRVGNGSWKWTI